MTVNKVTSDLGLQQTVHLSYALADQAEKDAAKRRSLLFSLYSFLCVFDDGERQRASKTLLRNGCSFLSRDVSLLKEPQTVHIKEEGGKGAVKFDAGSPLYDKMVACGRIKGAFAAYPEKLPLYTMVYRTVTLPGITNNLKALWYIYLPAVPLLDAPAEHDVYDKLKAVLTTDEVFAAVAVSPYAGALNTDTDVLAEIGHPVVQDWTGAYLAFLDGKGLPALYEAYRKQITVHAADAARDTQRLLARRPDDAELWRIYLAACAEEIRTLSDPKKRGIRIAETLNDIQEALESGLPIETELYYTRALMHLAVSSVPAAIEDLTECLAISPSFAPAANLAQKIKETLK